MGMRPNDYNEQGMTGFNETRMGGTVCGRGMGGIRIRGERGGRYGMEGDWGEDQDKDKDEEITTSEVNWKKKMKRTEISK